MLKLVLFYFILHKFGWIMNYLSITPWYDRYQIRLLVNLCKCFPSLSLQFYKKNQQIFFFNFIMYIFFFNIFNLDFQFLVSSLIYDFSILSHSYFSILIFFILKVFFLQVFKIAFVYLVIIKIAFFILVDIILKKILYLRGSFY